jgi:hypothetical protein
MLLANMLKAMFFGALVISLSMATPTLQATSLAFGERTILVYENQTREDRHQFVLRIARFRPDIFLEWESLNHQGTIHLRRKAVAESRKMTVGGLFEAGVDMDSKDVMTNWFSMELFQQLIREGSTRIYLNKRSILLYLVEDETRVLTVDSVEVEIPAVRIRDSLNGTWVVHKNARNPVLIEYQTQYYRTLLKRVSTSRSNHLRWIKQLPPVK